MAKMSELRRNSMVFLLAIALLGPGAAAGPDASAPVVVDLFSERSQYEPGDWLNITLDVTDETNVRYLQFNAVRVGGDGYGIFFQSQFSQAQPPGQFTLSSQIPANIVPGYYHVVQVYTVDGYDNAQWQSIGGVVPEERMTFAIGDPNAPVDASAPVVVDLFSERSQYEPGDWLNITLDVTDETNVRYLQFNAVRVGGDGYGIFFQSQFSQAQPPGQFTLSSQIPANIVPGYYHVVQVYTVDGYDNAQWQSIGGVVPEERMTFAIGQVAPSIATTSSPTGANVIPGTSASDTATVSGSGPTPSGTITFFLCQPAEVTTGGCEGSAGSQTGGPVTLSGGTATSASTTDTAALGKYCWRAVYSGDSSYASATHTNAESECFTVEVGAPPPPGVTPAPPTNLAPGTTDPDGPEQVSLTPTLTWSASTGATTYYVNVRQMSNNELIVNAQNVGNMNQWLVPVGVLENGETYRWGVQAGNAIGISQQSTPIYIQTPMRGLVLAFGDSVAAGHGLGGAADGYPNNAPEAFPGRVATAMDMDVANFAITGACTTARSYFGGSPQTPLSCAAPKSVFSQILDYTNRKAADPNLQNPSAVLLSVGANDIEFATCFMELFNGNIGMPAGSTGPCDGTIFETNLDAYAQNLRLALEGIRVAVGPDPPITVVQYFNPFPSTPSALSFSGRCEMFRAMAHLEEGFLSTTEEGVWSAELRTYSHSTRILGRLNEKVATVAQAKGAIVASPDFSDQDMCRGDRDWRQTGTVDASQIWAYPLRYESSVGATESFPRPGAPEGSAPLCPDNLPDFPGGQQDWGVFRVTVNCTPHPTPWGHAAIAETVLRAFEGS